MVGTLGGYITYFPIHKEYFNSLVKVLSLETCYFKGLADDNRGRATHCDEAWGTKRKKKKKKRRKKKKKKKKSDVRPESDPEVLGCHGDAKHFRVTGAGTNRTARYGHGLSQIMIGKGILLNIYMLKSLINIFFSPYKYTEMN